MDRRVTARTKARARAARPASWALATGSPSGRAEVSAIVRVRAFLPGVPGLPGLEADGFGASVGNKPAASPDAGLSAGVGVETLGRLPPGRGVTTAADVEGVGAPAGTTPVIARADDSVPCGAVVTCEFVGGGVGVGGVAPASVRVTVGVAESVAAGEVSSADESAGSGEFVCFGTAVMGTAAAAVSAFAR
jgi:hypothetical protein